MKSVQAVTLVAGRRTRFTTACRCLTKMSLRGFCVSLGMFHGHSMIGFNRYNRCSTTEN